MRTRSLVIAWFLLSTGGIYGQSLTPRRAAFSTEPAITVRVYNYARLSRSELELAERVATKVFAESGIPILWYDCVPSRRTDEDPNCGENVSLTTFDLRVCRNCTSLVVPHEHDVRGYVTGETATVSSNWSDEFSRALYVPPEQLLGRVVVHELGHLLLGPAHSRVGIMKARWRPEDLQQLNLRMLSFTSEQAALIKSNLERRHAANDAMLTQATPLHK